MATERFRWRDAREESTDVDDGRPRFDTETLAWGVVGGLIATVVMTLYRLPITRTLPPTAAFWAKYVGDEGPEAYPLLALHLHLLYGAGGGAAFALAYEQLPPPKSVAPETRATLLGLCYGLALSAFGKRVLLETLLERELEADEATVFHASHAIYGLTLGTWVASRGEEGAGRR